MELYGFFVIILLAALLQGVTGFGFALIAAPLALLFIDKTTAVVSLTFVSIALNGYLLWRVRGRIDARQFKRLFFASLAGLPLGLVVLKTFSIDTLRVLVGSLSVLFAVLLYRRAFSAVFKPWTILVAGFLSGALHTSISMSGPPIALLLAGQDTEKDSARRTFAAFFLAMSLISIALFAATSTLTESGLVFGLWGIPASLLGAYAGAILAGRVSQRQFTTLVLSLVCIAGLLTIYSGMTS